MVFWSLLLFYNKINYKKTGNYSKIYTFFYRKKLAKKKYGELDPEWSFFKYAD